MAEETQFGIIETDCLVWPASLRLPTKRFRLFVAADAAGTTIHEISEFAHAALAKGMVYLCVWGRGCQLFHDIVDSVIVEDDQGEREFAGAGPEDVITTTWHDHDTLETALDFFARCAIPTEGFLDDSDYRLVVCVGNPEWASAASRFLRASPLCRTTLEKTAAEIPPRVGGDRPSEERVRPDNSPAEPMPTRRQGSVAALVFDSSRQPAAAGVRGAAPPARQFMFESGDIVVDVVADTSERDLVHLVGQVMRKQDPYLNVPVTLHKGAEKCATFTNRFGEFQFETGNTADLNLVIALSGSRVIEIPLGVLEDPRPA